MSWRVGVVFDDDFLELIHDYVPMYKEGGGGGGHCKSSNMGSFLMYNARACPWH